MQIHPGTPDQDNPLNPVFFTGSADFQTGKVRHGSADTYRSAASLST